MKTRLAWLALALALGGCAGAPQWDTSVFPEQVVYDGQPATATVAAEKK